MDAERLSLANAQPTSRDMDRAAEALLEPGESTLWKVATAIARERQACIDLVYRHGVGGASADPLAATLIDEMRKRGRP